jgi:hypothetical protein
MMHLINGDAKRDAQCGIESPINGDEKKIQPTCLD